jgi:hypothetical protein
MHNEFRAAAVLLHCLEIGCFAIKRSNLPGGTGRITSDRNKKKLVSRPQAARMYSIR